MKRKLIVSLIAVFVLSMISALAVMAGERISIKDMTGNELEIKEGEVLASSDLEISLNTALLQEGELYALSELNDKGEKGIIEPLKEGKYLLREADRKARRLEFFILDEANGDITPLYNGTILINFMQDEIQPASAELTYREASELEGVTYITGEKPVLKVGTVEGLKTYVTVTDSKGSRTYEVTKEENSFAFPEGAYGISVYTQDGWGRVKHTRLPFNSFIYDNTPPSKPELEIKSEKDAASLKGGTCVYNGNVEITARSEDAVSGVYRYIFRFSDGSTVNGSHLVLQAPLEENVEVFALDRAGNISGAGSMGCSLIIDSQAPVMTSHKIRTTDDSYRVELKFNDALSGMEEVEVTTSDTTLYSRSFDKRLTGEIKTEFVMDPDKLKDGNNRIKVSLKDKAGNRSEYSFDVEKYLSVPPHISIEGTKEGEVHTSIPVAIKTEITPGSGDRTEYKINLVKRDERGNVSWKRECSEGDLSINEEGYYTLEVLCADSDGNSAELIRNFTVDTDAPRVASLEEYNKRVLSSFGFKGDPGSVISDYSHVDYDIFLNGSEYDGRDITEEGKYVLKLVASDELGRVTTEKAEFIISSNSPKEKDEAEKTLERGTNMKESYAPALLDGKKYTVKNPSLKSDKHKKTVVIKSRQEEDTAEEQASSEKKKGILERIKDFFAGLTP